MRFSLVQASGAERVKYCGKTGTADGHCEIGPGGPRWLHNTQRTVPAELSRGDRVLQLLSVAQAAQLRGVGSSGGQ